ncbi:MAG: hypothetical protein P0Y50_12965 [Candidatus Brevundimonas colombiensis]|uniref:Lipoprotein n=1 Tax=Candidatus Brevundimonas colombiensis TaxID=3121376 RepID=A0AAJ6BLC4_9CAUL|nr:hypothetical protein [Brevundimonas sp.]WEK39441.1 MAG: hypothetical protein P0Y50_12965 [Brevundimonas sp.]
MRTLFVSIGLLTLTSACAPDPRMPETSYQWQRRQERIEQEFRASQPATPPKTSASKDKP